MSNGMDNGGSENQVIILGVILVVLISSLGLNIFLFKNYGMINAQSQMAGQQLQQAQNQIQMVDAMINDLKGYAADKPELQKILQSAGVQ